ncbi:aldehyde dehydrogenase family protein [Lysobacter sp. 22409]|uniref:aldehyde dehydrogenase family protein n=1 Tax=Lysobacter sp. 22409 TaxID=3453917 RepID=UPI003F87E7BF
MTQAANETAGAPAPAHSGEALDALRRTLSQQPPAVLIDGTWRASVSGRTLEVDDPASENRIAVIAAGDGHDIDLAVAAARRAFREGPWPRLPASKRAALLFALADAIEARQEEFALLESLDAGHSLASIRKGDLPLGLRSLRDYAGWATKIAGEVPMRSADQAGMDYFLREPIGVAAIVTPWNAPFLMVLQKLAAALAAGCTTVIKPAELAPLSALRIGELCRQVGIPDGVVNIVTGEGASAGQALAEHPDVNLISFTGSTEVGRSIMAAAARSNLKRVVLELGGKSPVVVFADADVDKAAQAIVAEIAFKSGQYCAAGSRVFVQHSIHGALLERMHAAMDRLRIGAGYDETTDMGPMISQRQRQRAEAIIQHSLAAGARALRGGRARPGPGYFFEPTLLTEASADMRIAREEIFAPAIVVTPFADDAPLAAVAALANDSRYGLSAKLWARDLGTVHGLIGLLETGQVIVNGGGGEATLPFGGVKQSGYGRENGHIGLSAFTEIKAVRLGY